MLYISQSERDPLSTALQEAPVGDDEDEGLHLMDCVGVRTAPTQENLNVVLLRNLCGPQGNNPATKICTG